ncbi:hypothetical protein NEMBOFW57_005765 [Staphylotrichum longicolle]|uniref:Phospholipase/carboxylesterase/thioesterase domain-containing protein n=1 Tax=Staphylotrichum longicolle TaxID=669026 RepID=A0AAD4EXM3_9PEZI|nr:hypothetical protein NEMBOFW57_005765 [Staphylotrichum longicolle]
MAPDPPGFFPPPRTTPPLSPPHRTTLILLHGRGLSAHTFGPDILSASFPPPPPIPNPSPTTTITTPPLAAAAAAAEPTTLPTLLPHTKHIFPLAPRHRATIYKRSVIHQWFDSWHLDCGSGSDLDVKFGLRTDTEEWRAVDGLRDTVAHVHALVRTEAAAVGGPRNVVLGGLSQGCAAGLAATLLWDDGEEEALGGGDEGEDEDVEDGEGVLGVEARVVKVLREMLELEGGGRRVNSRPKAFDTPIFLGHGTEDDKVPVVRGRGAAECLRAAGMRVEWREYNGLGHWYSADMLTDIASFLANQVGWELENKVSS